MLLAILLNTVPAVAQSLYGTRLVGVNGWKTPVASMHLGSDEHDHINRGSVQAIDLIAPEGSAVYPIAAGRVIYAGGNNAGGYGWWVMIAHGNGYSSIYGHCIENSIRVQSGQSVTADTVLCGVGWTGKTSFGPHVHLEIHTKSSSTGRIDPTTIWPRSAFYYEKLGAAKSSTPVGAVGYRSIGRGYGGNFSLVWVLLLMFFAIWLLWSPRRPLRNGAYHGAMLAALTAIIPLIPVLSALFPVDGALSQMGGTDFDTAYAITRKWEGASVNSPCVVDPVLTRYGVTQTTYSLYLQSLGKAPRSVCSIGQREVKDIYYRRYWLPSGADRLPLKLAITHFDFAINAGVGAAEKALKISGGSVKAYNNYRYAYYTSLRDCRVYCAGWLNRLNDIRKYTE